MKSRRSAGHVACRYAYRILVEKPEQGVDGKIIKMNLPDMRWEDVD
jgi:hypothetical protein